jgi:hypothetical protein
MAARNSGRLRYAFDLEEGFQSRGSHVVVWIHGTPHGKAGAGLMAARLLFRK